MFDNLDAGEIGRATLDTLLMLGGSLALTVLFGVPLGVLLYLSGRGRLAANPALNAVLSFVVNVLRSIPFIILLIVMLPVTVLLVGTSLGVAGAIPPLVAGATVTAIALVSYTAMAGVVGAGGLGDLAIRFGYQRFQTDVMVVTVVLLLVLVQGLQMLGDRLVAAASHQ
jgi:D-methionine transport system permease protein